MYRPRRYAEKQRRQGSASHGLSSFFLPWGRGSDPSFHFRPGTADTPPVSQILRTTALHSNVAFATFCSGFLRSGCDGRHGEATLRASCKRSRGTSGSSTRNQSRLRPLRHPPVPPALMEDAALARSHRAQPLPRAGPALRLQRPAVRVPPGRAVVLLGRRAAPAGRGQSRRPGRPAAGNIYLPVDSFLAMPFIAQLQVALLSGAMARSRADLAQQQVDEAGT